MAFTLKYVEEKKRWRAVLLALACCCRNYSLMCVGVIFAEATVYLQLTSVSCKYNKTQTVRLVG